MTRVLMNTASPDNIEISTTWRSVRRALPLLFLLGIGAGANTFDILSTTRPQYTSKAQIHLATATTQHAPDESPNTLDAQNDRAAINAHVRAIISTDLAVEVIEQERLADNPEFNDALGSPTMLDRMERALRLTGPQSAETKQLRVLDAYYKHLGVYAAENERVITIAFSAADPQLAANVSNRLAKDYIALLRRRAESEKTQLQKALQRKIATLTREVADAEAAVERFRGLAAIFNKAPEDAGSNSKQLDELRRELSRAQAVRTAAAARVEDARELVAVGSADALPEFQESPLIQNLIQQGERAEKRISELSATLLPQHPRMRQLRAEIKGLKRQATREVRKVLAGIERKAMVAARRVDEVQNRLDDMRSPVIGTGGDVVPIRHYEEMAISKREELGRLEKRLEVSRARYDSRTIPVEAAITMRAQPPAIQNWAKKLPNSALVAFVVLLIGLAFVLTKALFTAARSAVSARQDASELPENSNGHLVMDVEHMWHSPAGSSGMPLVVDTVSGLADQLRVLAPGAGGFRTLLTCETAELDPANEAVELVKELAVSGAEVMLIDWCLDGRGVAEKIGALSWPGLSEVLQGKAKFDDVVVRVPGSGVYLVPSGGGATSTAALLDPDQVNLALDAFDTAYDHIVVVGKHAVARDLFEVIEGRFDAGVMVMEGRRRAGVFPDPPGTFLGFEVIDIELFRLERTIGQQLAQERTAHFTGHNRLEAQAS
ncbi:MAG: GumC family protein [Hyphomicrobium sp.]